MSNEPRFSNQQDGVVPQQHSTQDWAQWKALLPQLAGLPLLPICAKPPECKVPVDPSTGYGLENWQTTDLHFTPEQIAAMNGCVIAVGFRTGSDGVLVVDVESLSALEWLLTHGVNPTDIHTWQIWRTTSDDRFKLVFRLTAQQQALFPNDKILIRFPKRDGQEKGDALEMYYQGGAQVVVAGAHNSSGVWYCWRNAQAAVIAPDATVFAALVALRDERDRRRGLGGCGGSKGSTKAAAGEWADSSERRPCPVCGRGHTGACAIHRSGDAVSCYEGATNYPPQPEGGWILGKTVIGYDGRTWAYIKPDYVAEIGDKRIFKIDQPREQQPAAQSVPFSDSFDDLLGPPPPNTAKAPAIVLTPKQRVAELAAYAEELYASGAAQATRLPLLRIKAKQLEIPPYRDQELSRLIWAARRKAQGTSDGVAAGEVLNVSPQRWHWEGVLMAGCLNLIVALPKLDKTGLMLAMIAAWHQGEPDFLGYPLIGPCPPVLIVGPDMPENDWATMLKQYGLMGDDNRICEPIVKLYHMGTPIHFDADGIERITIEAERYLDHGLFILCDSLRKLTAGLGLKEESAEIAEPVHDLMEAVATTGATVALIHHADKGRAQGSGVEASSGNPALPAAASQVIQLKAVATGDDGWRDPSASSPQKAAHCP